MIFEYKKFTFCYYYWDLTCKNNADRDFPGKDNNKTLMWLVSQKACVQGAVLTYTWENYYDVALAGIERSIRYISMILSLFGGILI